MAAGSQKVLTQVLKLIDAHDLYGSVAYPKHHAQTDISDIYLFAGETRGVFVNIALQEPFGLTVIEAAAHGVPTVATCNGGPVDIMATLHHGVVVEPTDSDAVAHALLSILTSPETWDSMSDSGVKNIMSYSWPAHCKRYMETMDGEYRHKNPNAQSRTFTGMMQRRLSRLDLLGIADVEGVPQSPVQEQSYNDINRHLSTPGDITPLLSGQATPKAPNRQTSGFTTDDFDIINSMKVEAALYRVTEENEQRSKRRKEKYVVIPLDCDAFAEEVSSLIKQVLRKFKETRIDDIVGVGILSMLGFDSTCDHLTKNGIQISQIDFLVCNGGADVWICRDSGQWVASEEYENLINFVWDRTYIHRMLKKIISSKSENSQILPKLKELLYNVGEEREEGIHPRHICIELDPETQQILSSGMGPKARSTQHLRFLSLIVSRLKKKLRSRGVRANYTLQIVPKQTKEHLAVLHITPIRASRPLALRCLAQYLGINMCDFIMAALPAFMKGDSKLDGQIVPWTSDAADLVAGMQKVQVVIPGPDSALSLKINELSGLDDAMGIPLWPWSDVDRINVSEGVDNSLSGIVHMVLSQEKVEV